MCDELEVVKVFVLPGGRMPERQTKGAIGFDVFIRAVVSAQEMDAENPTLRKTIFDFERIPHDDPFILPHVQAIPGKEEFGYLLNSGESVLVGIGVVTEFEYPYFYWVAPRSGLASKYGITVTNAPGTVDPDYRGEAGVVVLNRSKNPFLLRRGMRIAQIIFQRAHIPQLAAVDDYFELSGTDRGAGGFGSTGLQ